MDKIGKTILEKSAEDSTKCREIVRTILDFGVNEQQILRIAYLLSLELENKNIMLEVSSCIKKHVQSLVDSPTSEIIIE